MKKSSQDRLLVVDDDEAMRWTVRRILEPFYQVVTVSGPVEALERVKEHHYRIALVDVQLDHQGDGYDLCRDLREISPQTDVILMTGSVSQADAKLYLSLEKDAFYFLFKPFERRVLRALVERCLRMQREREAKEGYARRLAADLEKARDFQHSLLPREPLATKGWRLEGCFLPCEDLGGDLYSFTADEGRDSGTFVICDVVGHGVSAAMYAGMLRSTLDAARRRDAEPARLIHDLIRGVDFFEDNKFATCFYARYYEDGRVRYFNAGHPPAYHQKKDGSLVELGSTGLPLSQVFLTHPRHVKEIVLKPGERILAYTDGLTEASDPEGRQFDTTGIAAVLAETRNKSAAATLQLLLERVAAHRHGRPSDDDLTALLVERRA